MSALRVRDQRGLTSAGVLVAGTILSLVLAFVVTVLLPITGESASEGAAADPRTYDDGALAGRALYIRESCFSCHTQSVRDAFSDSLLGPTPSGEGLYANEAPNLIGAIRLGPDLTCVGDRQTDPGFYVEHLKDPASVREHSTMPSYDYLSNAELQALAAYLLRLTCEEG